MGWLRGHIYGRPQNPRRWTWLLVTTCCYVVGTWFAGSLVRWG
jgi:hypothetical protein